MPAADAAGIHRFSLPAGLGGPGPAGGRATVYAQAVQNPREPHWLYDVVQFDGIWLTPRHPVRGRAGAGLAVRLGPAGLAFASGGGAGRLPGLLPLTCVPGLGMA